MPSLDKSSFVLQNRQSLLESSNLCSATGSSFFVCFGLGHAAVFDLAVVFIDRCKLGGSRVLVSCELGDALVKRLEFLGLVLDILFLRGLSNLVLLCQSIVLGLGIRFG